MGTLRISAAHSIAKLDSWPVVMTSRTLSGRFPNSNGGNYGGNRPNQAKSSSLKGRLKSL